MRTPFRQIQANAIRSTKHSYFLTTDVKDTDANGKGEAVLFITACSLGSRDVVRQQL